MESNLNMKPLVIYHSPCADGTAAAFVAWRHFESLAQPPGSEVQADFFPASYGVQPPDVKGREVYMLDFSYPLDQMMQIATDAKSLTVADHHKTAQPTLEKLSDIFPDNRVGIFFSLNHSGAHLAWKLFFPQTPPPPLILYVEDRDLWRFQLPHSHEVNAYISNYPHDFVEWDYLNSDLKHDADARGHLLGSSPIVTAGKHILDTQKRLIEEICKEAVEVEFDGRKILATNCNAVSLASDVAKKLSFGRPFGMSWFYRRDGQYQFSLRSDEKMPDCVDVSAIAKKYGGGGHVNAAGLQVHAGDIHPAVDTAEAVRKLKEANDMLMEEKPA